jgi:hypothetical protein
MASKPTPPEHEVGLKIITPSYPVNNFTKGPEHVRAQNILRNIWSKRLLIFVFSWVNTYSRYIIFCNNMA